MTGAFTYLFRGATQAGNNNGSQGGIDGIPVVGQIAQGLDWVGNQVNTAFGAAINETQNLYDSLIGGNSSQPYGPTFSQSGQTGPGASPFNGAPEEIADLRSLTFKALCLFSICQANVPKFNPYAELPETEEIQVLPPPEQTISMPNDER
ncbi:hypothetical protein AiwAL_15500 [Acidiphilium sp. AL]|uniref:Uncharacterized protein n=1 Tax=Acidiphilium iwatense TaxID=768198 RepID=A0ABS9DZI3_9PROT|nr:MULTISPECIES: hypothetical protein [Acidiphilium]MCF3948103.1 hypothetical protein [Acidiphilium iwatense]MCU4161490.1 hypothetical protein [Acidiphilium sp. AL]